MQHHPHCFLGKNCLAEWQTAINTNASLVNYNKGERIVQEGTLVTGFYFIHTGRAKIHKQWGEGRELILNFAGPGDIMGHRGMLEEQHYPVSATAIEPLSACFITADFFKTTLLVNHMLAYKMVLFYANELRNAEQNMRNMAHMDVKTRIANALLKLQDIFGVDKSGAIKTTLSRQDMASFASTSYETLFKTLNDFIKEGIIQTTGKSISIQQEQALRALVKI